MAQIQPQLPPTNISPQLDEEYISTIGLARRWACSRSSADRIARRAGFAKLLLGTGRNGLVRYTLSEVVIFERQRTIHSQPK